MSERYFIANVPGFDLRRITPQSAPFVHGLLADHPPVILRGQPTTELWPTLVTGVNPGVHDIWHCKIDRNADARDSALGRMINELPDWMVTTPQLLRHFVDKKFDMPAIPRWRRRQLEMHRLKFNARSQSPDRYRTVGGVQSIFGLLGDDAHYCVASKYEEFPGYLDTLPDPRYKLQWLEVHAFDLFVHYYLDRPQVLEPKSRELDDFLRALHNRCRDKGFRFVLLVDHGQELVRGHIDIRKVMENTGVPREEYCYFQAVAVSKLWFKSDRARERITKALRGVERLNLLSWQEMNESFGLKLDADWGELYAIPDHGYLFHPHDFHHWIANLYSGISSPTMRRRLTTPYHIAYHGQLPDHPSEEGFFTIADPSVRRTAERGELIDFAPTLLRLMGSELPERMEGRPTFEDTRETVDA